jgi:hypothetical protein
MKHATASFGARCRVRTKCFKKKKGSPSWLFFSCSSYPFPVYFVAVSYAMWFCLFFFCGKCGSGFWNGEVMSALHNGFDEPEAPLFP